MAAKVDIRKVSLQGADFYTPVSDQLAFTAIGRLKGIPEENRPLLNDRFAFCRLLRRLVRMLLDGKRPQKAKLTKQYRVPSRVYNLALETAKGLIKGTMEAQKAALEDTKLEIADNWHVHAGSDTAWVVPQKLRIQYAEVLPFRALRQGDGCCCGMIGASSTPAHPPPRTRPRSSSKQMRLGSLHPF
jgi:hypothetical protein